MVQRRGLLVTAVPLTILEAAVALGPQRGAKLLDRALQRTVGFDAVHLALCRNLGRHGSASAGQLLATTADRAGSQAERIMIKLLRDEGLIGWRRGYRIGDYEADFAFPAECIAVEVDGWAWHNDVVRFRHDRQRQNALVLAGWTVLRFTWHDLTQRPGPAAGRFGTTRSRDVLGHRQRRHLLAAPCQRSRIGLALGARASPAGRFRSVPVRPDQGGASHRRRITVPAEGGLA